VLAALAIASTSSCVTSAAMTSSCAIRSHDVDLRLVRSSIGCRRRNAPPDRRE
jgi:hypothetical protein